MLSTLIARMLVGILFIVAGWSKLHAGKSIFLQTVLAYELLPRPLASAVARSLPLMEVMVGSMLFVGLFTQPFAYFGVALLIMVTGAVVIALIQKKTISCGCFGPKEKVAPMRWTIVIRNVVIMLMLSIVSTQNKEVLALDNILKAYVGNTESWSISLLMAVVLILLSYLYTRYSTTISSRSELSA